VATTSIAIVAEPGPDTLRVEMALFNAQKKRTAMNFISGVMPIGMRVEPLRGRCAGQAAGGRRAQRRDEVTVVIIQSAVLI
jgi:hypothetical protein